MTWPRAFILAMLVVAAYGAAVALGDIPGYATCCGLDHKFKWEQASGSITNETAQMAMNDVQYPLAQIHQRGGFLERVNLRERLLRFNDPNKIGYVYILSSLSGKPVGYYTIKGKITSTDSQMTQTEQASRYGNGDFVIAAPGDDGSWGQNEGGPQGIFFFTTTGVMVETVMPWLYSDAPLPLSVPSLNPTKKPSNTSVFWKKAH